MIFATIAYIMLSQGCDSRISIEEQVKTWPIEKFTTEKWVKDDHRERYKFYNDIINNHEHELIGSTEKEILALLGEPDLSESNIRGWDKTFSYLLTKDATEWYDWFLEIMFQKGIVKTIRLRTNN